MHLSCLICFMHAPRMKLKVHCQAFQKNSGFKTFTANKNVLFTCINSFRLKSCNSDLTYTFLTKHTRVTLVISSAQTVCPGVSLYWHPRARGSGRASSALMWHWRGLRAGINKTHVWQLVQIYMTWTPSYGAESSLISTCTMWFEIIICGNICSAMVPFRTIQKHLWPCALHSLWSDVFLYVLIKMQP